MTRPLCIFIALTVAAATLLGAPHDIDRQLGMIEQLLDAWVTAGIDDTLTDLSQRPDLNDAQRGMLHVLRGRLFEAQDQIDQARGSYLTARALYPDTDADLVAAIRLARFMVGYLDANEPAVLIESAMRRHAQSARLPEAALALIDIETSGDGRVAALRQFLERWGDHALAADAMHRLAEALEMRSGAPTPESLSLKLDVLRRFPDTAQGRMALTSLENLHYAPVPAAALDALAEGLERLRQDGAPYAQRIDALAIETALSRGRLIDDVERLAVGMDAARLQIDRYEAAYTGVPTRAFATRARVRSYLIVGERAALKQRAVAALEPLAQARRLLYELSNAPAAHRPDEYATTAELARLARIYEIVDQHELAYGTWRLLHRLWPAAEDGRDALHRAAELQAGPMGDAPGAIETFALYGAMYPPLSELERQNIIDQVRKFGFDSIAEFQAAAGLGVDGLAGPQTWEAIWRWEATFRDSLPPSQPTGILEGGQYVHDRIFGLAERLRREGRYREAVKGFRTFVALYPRNHRAGEALAAIAQIFIDTGLYREALGVCRELIDDFPKDLRTRGAHLDAALCHENLGQWAEAARYYELFVRMYPHDERVADARNRLLAVEDIIPYQRLIDDGPPPDKLAEAHYDVGKILYERLERLERAAAEFGRTGSMDIRHYRVPEALFMVGTVHLHRQQFSAARGAFAELVRRFPDSRLADDGQFWIGHTFEYHARALGRLDARAVVLQRRAFGARQPLIDDVELRRLYNPGVEPGEGADAAPVDGLELAEVADTAERVKLLLAQAIEAYGRVAADFPQGDMAERALWRIGVVHLDYIEDADAGMAAFERLLRTYPGTRYGQEAQFRVGRHYLENEQYARAREAFERYAFAYPHSEQAEEALLNVARCFEAERQWDEALDRYERYLNRHPEGRYAEQARQKVEWIRRFRF